MEEDKAKKTKNEGKEMDLLLKNLYDEQMRLHPEIYDTPTNESGE